MRNGPENSAALLIQQNGISRATAAAFVRYDFGHKAVGSASDREVSAPHSPELLALAEGAVGVVADYLTGRKAVGSREGMARYLNIAILLRAVADEVEAHCEILPDGER